MARTTRIVLPLATGISSSTVPVFIPVTEFMDAADVAKLRGTLEMGGRTGQFSASIAYQTAQVPNSVDTPAAITSTVVTNGVTYPTGGYTDVSTPGGAKRLIRIGYYVALVTGTTLAYGFLSGEVDIVRR